MGQHHFVYQPLLVETFCPQIVHAVVRVVGRGVTSPGISAALPTAMMFSPAPASAHGGAALPAHIRAMITARAVSWAVSR